MTYKILQLFKKRFFLQYGYRLPEDDSNLLYYQVYFKLVGEMLFTYPDVCIRPRPALTFPRADPAPILSAFLADLAARLPAACGQPLRLVRDPAYTTPALLRPSDQVVLGPLMGGPQCRLSILRNGNVPCRYFGILPVDFKIALSRLSILSPLSLILKCSCRF